jgi:hypothetical protein
MSVVAHIAFRFSVGLSLVGSGYLKTVDSKRFRQKLAPPPAAATALSDGVIDHQGSHKS